VRSAWYAHATSQQVLRLHSGSARAAQIAAQLADRYRDAGNISALQHSREQAESSIARIALQKQRATAVAARARLFEKMGVMDRADIIVREQLPLPLATNESATDLQELALRQRLDIAALRTAGEMLQQQRSHARRWRLIDGVRVEAKRERDTGDALNGGGVSMELPLFNAGGGKVLRAQAASEAAAAEIRAAELAARRDVISHQAALMAADRRVNEYRARLLPLRARNVELSQQQANYMLIGTFDLISARRAEMEAWVACIEALGEYWQVRVALARAVGGQLPEDAAAVLELPALPTMDEAGELP
jgi:outer membrane protein, heavy metal efflux system